MPALNFHKQFAEAILSGAKRQTIRAKRKNPIRAGHYLALYTGQRTSQCRKLMDAHCLRVLPIIIEEFNVILDGRKLWEDEMRELARADGFDRWDDFVKWFDEHHDGLPFEGEVIYW
jgi:hypothetical protein